MAIYRNDARIILGMVARGDKEHNIAAWFGENQARVAEAKKGDYGTLEAAPEKDLPPAGPPGVKGRRLRSAIDRALEWLDAADLAKAETVLRDAIGQYDKNED